jgi:uncharacterized protein (DUF433 family)
MPSVKTQYEHIVLEEKVPVIAGTTMKVTELVLEKTAYGWSPEELHFQHPDLSLGQIHSALAYYWDHRPELERDLERRLHLVEQAREACEPSPLVDKLRQEGLL